MGLSSLLKGGSWFYESGVCLRPARLRGYGEARLRSCESYGEARPACAICFINKLEQVSGIEPP